jgi:hypothetical protein
LISSARILLKQKSLRSASGAPRAQEWKRNPIPGCPAIDTWAFMGHNYFNMNGPNQVELAYFAGLIDGEGSLGIYYNHNYFSLRLQIAMTNEEVLRWVEKHFGGKVNFRVAPSHLDREDRYYWACGDRYKLAWLLPLIQPFLIVKKAQATLMIDFCALELTHDEQLKYVNCMAQLNRRGRGSNLVRAAHRKLLDI